MMSFAKASFLVDDEALNKCLRDIAEAEGYDSAEQFTQIKCNSKGIRSIAGIEQFTNLSSLSVFNNKLQMVDAKLDDLPKLTELNIARNRLKNLSLNNLKSIEKVYAFDNKLEQISLENLPRLSMIKAQNNKAGSFSYQDVPLLSKIYIFNNQLEHMDIHNLPSITYVDCRQNPMPDPLYDEMDAMKNVSFLHDGNADDW
ncbi:leucine-rich repeat domain-containing protein [Agaribacter flavus]|uniref:Leucine-rich repeat domain-containing protein n=1 Tax=Agaribacter flavus TaxID=1902781 RepID=A0ABV7FN48_9ALTE